MVLEQRLRGNSRIWPKRNLDQRLVVTDYKRQLNGLKKIIARGDLAAHLEAFLIACQVNEYSRDTINDYRAKLGHFVTFLAELGIKTPQKVNVSHIRLFVLHKQERCNAVTIYNYHRNIRRFFNWLIEEGVIRKSPMATLKAPKQPKTIIQPFRDDQIGQLLLLCDDTKFIGARNKAIVLTFLDTGLRLRELSSIQLDAIDFDRETIKVMGKGAKERVVRIGKRSQRALLRYLLMRNDTFSCLWVSEEHKPLGYWGVSIAIHKLCQRAELTGIRGSPHTFRHTFATSALLNGAREDEVQSLLGHETLYMTAKYRATLNSQNAVEGHRQFSPVDRLRLK